MSKIHVYLVNFKVRNNNLYKEKKNYVTLSQISRSFDVSVVQVFLKTLWQKEKLLVTSNFSFSHIVFYPFGDLSAILH